MYHLPVNPLPRRFSNCNSNLRSADSFPYKTKQKTIKKNIGSRIFISISFGFVCTVIWNYQPYLILTLNPSQSSCARHDMGDVGPIDRMG